MKVIQNPRVYDEKVPTNIRLELDLKTKAIEEAEKRSVTLAQVVNEALSKRYNKGSNIDNKKED